MKHIGITSGYFDPIHFGHLECLRLAKDKCDSLWVIVNNKYQTFLKRGSQPFQEEECRLAIVGALRYVDRVVLATDRDPTVCLTLEALIKEAQAEGHTVSFMKGGDRSGHNTPEVKLCEELKAGFIDGLGDKVRSSSEYLKRVRE